MILCCCGSCTVRTGTVIIGVLTLINAIYQVGKYCVLLAVAYQELCTLGDQSAREIKYPDYTDEKIDELTLALKIGIAISLAALLLYLIQLCLTISLLRGVSTANHRLILPWYYFHVVMFVVSVVTTAGIIGLLVVAQHGAVLYAAIAATLMFGFWWLFLSVLKDYIDELRIQSQRDNSNTVIPAITAGKTEMA